MVNGKNNCQVRLTLATYMQLTTRFQTDIATFYKNGGDVSILSKIVAFLNIDPSQVKIVSVNSGSVVINFAFYPSQINQEVNVSSNSSDPNNQFFVSPPIDPIKSYN